MKPTDTIDFFQSLNAGVFAGQIGHALSDVGAAVADPDIKGKGKVVITLELSQIGDSNQVKVDHKLVFTTPTRKGERIEKTATNTPMYVTPEGLQLFQNNPTAQLFQRQDTPVKPEQV